MIALSYRTRAHLDGTLLKELRSMKREVPSDFERYLKELFHFEALPAIKFRAQLEKLE